jgi:uncharacterized protein (DUF3084 family)
MDSSRVSGALRERLGHEATAGLVDLFNRVKVECTAEVIGIVGDRFERRLIEETSRLRVDMVQGFVALRQEIGEVRQEIGEVRQEIGEVRQEIGGVRQEMGGVRQEIAGVRQELRQEIGRELGTLRQEMAQNRFELLKWAFLFWVGQFFAVGSLVALLVRFLRPGT